MAAIIIWKILSIDYASLPNMLSGELWFHEVTPKWLMSLTLKWEPFFFGSHFRILVLQIAAAAAYLAFAITLKRWLLLAALVPSLMIEWAAWKFRGDLFDADFSMALFILIACWPAKWGWNLSRSREPDLQSSRIGFGLLIYLGVAYYLMGKSKLDIPDWIYRISLKDLLACVYSWHQIELPPAVKWTATISQKVFTAFPRFAIFSAALTLFAELFWFMGIFRWPIRYAVPLLMFGAHIIIYLGSGILFFGLAVSALSFIIPWRKIRLSQTNKVYEYGPSEEKITWRTLFGDAKMWLFTGVVVLSLYLPQRYGIIHPFNMFQFGWEYRDCPAPIDIYRLGYFDQKTSKYQIIPANYFGFMDFKGLLKQSHGIHTYSHAKDDIERALAIRYIEIHLKAVRPFESHRFILGQLAHPTHFATWAEERPLTDFQRVVLLKGKYHYSEQREQVDWHRIGDIEFDLSKYTDLTSKK